MKCITMDRKEMLLQELQMMTGIVSMDYDYLIYKLLYGSSKDFENESEFITVTGPDIEITELSSWFFNLT